MKCNECSESMCIFPKTGKTMISGCFAIQEFIAYTCGCGNVAVSFPVRPELDRVSDSYSKGMKDLIRDFIQNG